MNSTTMIIFIIALTGTGVLIGPCILALFVKSWRSEFPKVAIPFVLSALTLAGVSAYSGSVQKSDVQPNKAVSNKAEIVVADLEEVTPSISDDTLIIPKNIDSVNYDDTYDYSVPDTTTIVYPSNTDDKATITETYVSEIIPDNSVKDTTETSTKENKTAEESKDKPVQAEITENGNVTVTNNTDVAVTNSQEDQGNEQSISNEASNKKYGNTDNFYLYYDPNKHGTQKYVLNLDTKKVHLADCKHVRKIKPENWEETDSYERIMEYYNADNSWDCCQDKGCLKGYHLGYYTGTMVVDNTSTDSTTVSQQIVDENIRYVWIPKTGSKYHSNKDAHGMKDSEYVTESEAIARGFTPCSTCCW